MSGNHPDRNDMLKALLIGSVPFSAHLKECDDCRMLFDLLSQFRGKADSHPVASLSMSSLYRQMAIARLAESRNPERSVSGSVVFDSWRNTSLAATRDTTPGLERRLRLRGRRFLLELVGDRQLREWEFVARVYDRAKPTRQFILQVGRRKLYPEVQDCFYWSSPHPPRRIQLLSPSLRIDFGNITW